MKTQTTIPPTRSGEVPRRFPDSADDAAWTTGVVNALKDGVSLDAHALAHPTPQHDCPYGACADAAVPFRDRSAEVSWREDATNPPVRHEVAA